MSTTVTEDVAQGADLPELPLANPLDLLDERGREARIEDLLLVLLDDPLDRGGLAREALHGLHHVDDAIRVLGEFDDRPRHIVSYHHAIRADKGDGGRRTQRGTFKVPSRKNESRRE